MATVTRKSIAAALLATLTGGGQFTGGIGRRDNTPEQASSPGQPGLVLVKPREDYSFGSDQHGVPPVRDFKFHALIYTDVGADKTAVPADIIDDLMDVIDARLAPSVTDQFTNGGRQSLGGLVYDCRIEGTVEFAPGDIAGKGIVMVPICVIVQQYP